jgi:hypothetical protein
MRSPPLPTACDCAGPSNERPTSGSRSNVRRSCCGAASGSRARGSSSPAAGIAETEPELALLYFLASVDDYAETPDAIAGMRRALAVHRMVARVGGIGRRILSAALRDDAAVLAIADAGTNAPVVPSTTTKRVTPTPRSR